MIQNLKSIFIVTFFCISCYSCENTSLKFAVIGDWGGVPYSPFSTLIERRTARELVEITNKNNIEFVLGLGDNFYYSGVKDEHDPRFKTTFENVFKDSDAHIPWYMVAGNHDWRGNVSAQIQYSKYSSRWNFPNYFYSFERTIRDASSSQPVKISFLMLDTACLCGNIDSDFSGSNEFTHVVDEYTRTSYWKYVETSLMKFKDSNFIIVAGHYPVWSIGEHGPTNCLVERLDPLLKKYNVSVYLNGHDHTLEHIQVQRFRNFDMNYFTIGAANFFNNSRIHFNKIPLNSLKYHWVNMELSGGLGIISIEGKDKMKVELISSSSSIKKARNVLYSTYIKSRNVSN